MPKGYIIARVRVDDMEMYSKYTAQTPDAAAKFGGKFLVRNGKREAVEGPEEERRVVVIEYPTFEAARDFYYSDEYQEIVKIRHAASEGEMLLIEGYE